jgi:hypothetical protein
MHSETHALTQIGFVKEHETVIVMVDLEAFRSEEQ